MGVATGHVLSLVGRCCMTDGRMGDRRTARRRRGGPPLSFSRHVGRRVTRREFGTTVGCRRGVPVVAVVVPAFVFPTLRLRPWPAGRRR